MHDMLDEMVSLTGKLAWTCSPASFEKLQFKALKSFRSEPALRTHFRDDLFKRCRVLKCTTEWNEQFALDFVVLDLQKVAYDLICVANIASPGSLELADGIIVSEGADRTPPSVTNLHHKLSALQLRDAISDAREANWPKLQRLSFLGTWNWAHQFPGFTSGQSDSYESRALNALTNIMHDRAMDPLVQLMWTMVGIEALYNRGRETVVEQLREKCKVLLGEPRAGQTSVKTIIRQMYQFRSSFLHGGQDFSSALYCRDPEEKIDRKYITELFQAVNAAITILLASLQQLAKHNISSLNFTYTLTSSQ